MTDSERLARMERRIEALIQAIAGDQGLHATAKLTNAMLAELMQWLKQPPSTDLADTLKALAAQMAEMRTEIAGLPDKVARAVLDGVV